MIVLLPLKGIGEVRSGDDLALLLGDALSSADLDAFVPGDVLVVTQKIVSKAEGRAVTLASVKPDDEARMIALITGQDERVVALVLSESDRVLRAVPNVLICRHRLGVVMANAGIDRSNTGEAADDRVLLLPLDPDASAAAMRAAFIARFGTAPAVVISDSFGRPWRHGTTSVAIGASGLPCLIDARGVPDRDGRRLKSTLIALGDIVATAASLVTGECAESIPAALVRGIEWTGPENVAATLIRPLEQDLFQ